MDLGFTSPTKVAATTDTELAPAVRQEMDGLINNIIPRRKPTWFHVTGSPTMSLLLCCLEWRRVANRNLG